MCNPAPRLTVDRELQLRRFHRVTGGFLPGFPVDHHPAVRLGKDRVHTPAHDCITERELKRVLHIFRGAPGPLAGLEVSLQPLQGCAVDLCVVVARQLVFRQQRAGPVVVFEPLVESGAALGVGVGFKRHRPSRPPGELLRICPKRHHVRRGELARHHYRHVGRLRRLVLLDERRRVALPQREELALGVRRQFLHSRAHGIRRGEVVGARRIVRPTTSVLRGTTRCGVTVVCGRLVLRVRPVVPRHDGGFRHSVTHGGEVPVRLRFLGHPVTPAGPGDDEALRSPGHRNVEQARRLFG